MPKLELPGYVCFRSIFLATLVVSDLFFKIEKRSCRFEERCTAVLFGVVFVMAVHALDCKKDFDVHETLIKNVSKNIWEGRRAGTKDFYITGDFNVGVGLLWTGEDRQRPA